MVLHSLVVEGIQGKEDAIHRRVESKDFGFVLDWGDNESWFVVGKGGRDLFEDSWR